jgi:hypothetical protein
MNTSFFLVNDRHEVTEIFAIVGGHIGNHWGQIGQLCGGFFGDSDGVALRQADRGDEGETDDDCRDEEPIL